jgi:DNA-binding MarR family transcriptional regulator
MAQERDFSVRSNCVGFNLRRVARVVTNFFDAEMRRHGIRSTQGSILAALDTIGSTNMADLSEVLGMERTTLLRNLRPLQRDGLVDLEGGGHGGRVELSLTAKGRKQIEKFAPAWESAQRTAVEVLGEQRWSAILADLNKVAAALKN